MTHTEWYNNRFYKENVATIYEREKFEVEPVSICDILMITQTPVSSKGDIFVSGVLSKDEKFP